MASLSEIQRILEQIQDDLPALIQRSQVTPQQVVLVGGLSDLSERLGLVQAGEFRTGNGKEPGLGFSGVRIGYPAFLYDSALWNIVGVNNDVIQFGLRASDGVAIAGAGDVTLDGEGVWIKNQQAAFGFEDTSNNRFKIYLFSDGSDALVLKNKVGGAAAHIRMEIDAASGQVLYLIYEESATANVPVLRIRNGDAGATAVTFEMDEGVVIWAGQDGTATIFNNDNFDVDFIIEGTTEPSLFVVDAGLDAIGIGDLAESGYKLKVTGKLKVTEGILAENNANDLFRCNSPGGASLFTGTIATLPGGAVLTYNVSSGNEGAMVPTSTSQLAKMRLYNTTRGTSALISDCNTGTNTLTLTATVPAGWATTDTITIVSQTVSGGIFDWVDMEITSGPTGKTSLFSSMIIQSATAGNTIATHPFETFGAGKVQALRAHVTNIVSDSMTLLKITSNVFSMAWTGTPTAVILRELGYLQ